MRPQKEGLVKGVSVSDNTKTNFAKLILVEGIIGKGDDPLIKLAGSELMSALNRESEEKEQKLPSMKLIRNLNVDYDLLGKATQFTRSMQIRLADLALEGFSYDPHSLVDAVALMVFLENSDDKSIASGLIQSISSERYEKILASLLASQTITTEQAVGLTRLESTSPPRSGCETAIPSEEIQNTIPCIQSFSNGPVSDSGLQLKNIGKKASGQ
ncbi:hypothetical protein JXA56_03260 [Candidatus Micrarchaeota archaeon]|nr:hypothetical protein [Candidatus Micrarchaeota archaeon]